MFFCGENKGTLIACASAHMMNHIHMFILPALIPVFQRIFQLSYSQSSFLMASFFFGLAVLNPITGIWAAKHSKKIIVVVGVCAAGLMLLFISSVDSYEVLLFVLLVYGAFLAFYHTAGTTILANSFDESVRGKVMGIHSFGSNVGMILGPLVIGFFLKESTYQMALWFFCLLSLMIGGLAIWQIREVRNRPLIGNEGTDRLPHFRELLQMIRNQRFSLALISYGVRDGIYWGLFIFLPLYLVHQFRYSEGGAAGILGLLPSVGLLATISGGVVGDRLGRIHTMTASLVVVGLGLVAIPVIPPQEMVFYFLFLIVTFAIFATVPLFDATIADITAIHFRSVAYGYFFGLGCLLGGVVTVLGGVLSDLFSPGMAFPVLGICSFICAYLVWSVGKSKPIRL